MTGSKTQDLVRRVNPGTEFSPDSSRRPDMGKNQHVVPHKGGWAVRGEGNSRASSIPATQAEAIQAATELAVNQQSEVLIHGRDGRIRGRNGHSHDPSPPKGSTA